MRVRLYIMAALLICLLLLAYSIDAQPVHKQGISSEPINVIKPIREQGTAGQTGTTSQAGTVGQFGPVHLAGSTTLINFDDLVTGGAGGGGAILATNQYASKGVNFSGARAIDFSKGMAIPGFAHSGTIALEACYGSEFCTDPIEMDFNQPQSSVKVWVGIDTQSTAKQRYIVELSAFDATGQQVAYKYAVLNPITGPAPIQTPLQVSGSNIVRATVSYAPPSPSYNNGLAIDDVEFNSPLAVSGTRTL
jgi:hypothetical protein